MLDDSQFECTLKLLVLGGSSVGKSNFIHRFITNEFSEHHISSSGLELKSSDIIIKNKRIRIQLWDTAGQEKYKSITKSLFVKVQGIIAMFDLTKEESFKQIKFWIKIIREECGPRMPLILLGNKSDLENLIIISEKEIMDYVNKEKIHYIMTSSKTNLNIRKAVIDLCEEVLECNEAREELNSSFSLDSVLIEDEKKKKCCKS